MKQPLIALDLHQPAAGKSKHDRLKDYLIKEMISGRLKPGQSLPSERSLLKELGVARMTVRQVMTSLENEGLIRRVPRKGTFVDEDVRRKLKRGQDIFALVVVETHEGFYPALLRGFEAATSQLHHQTIICNTNNDVARQGDIILQLIDKEVGGVAINPPDELPTPQYQIRQLQKHGIPVVLCHRGVEGIQAPLLAIPFYELGRLAGKTLAENGHHRVAFFSGHPTPAMEACRHGLIDAIREGGGEDEVATACIEESPSLRERSIQAAVESMFRRPHPPTAIFASFDSLAETLFLVLPRLGFRVPDDVSLLGFGDVCRDGAVTQHLTSIVVDEMATGRQAASLLHDMRTGLRPIDDDTEIVMSLSVSDGDTLKQV